MHVCLMHILCYLLVNYAISLGLTVVHSFKIAAKQLCCDFCSSCLFFTFFVNFIKKAIH